MIDEKKKTRIIELIEGGASINEVANALEISKSTVRRYSESQENYNEHDEKISNEMTKIMLLEGYDFEDEIKPLVYALKDQMNEMDITLYDYLNGIKNNTNRFLRITEKPIRLYYIFILLASNLNLITDHINPQNLLEAIDKFIDREIEMEESEEYIKNCDMILEEKYEEWQEKILNAENKYNEMITGKKEYQFKKTNRLRETIDIQNKDISELKEFIQEALEKNNILSVFSQKLVEGAKIQKKEIQELKSENKELKQTLEKITQETLPLIKELERFKHENSLLEKALATEMMKEYFPDYNIKESKKLTPEEANEKYGKLQPEKAPIS